MKPLYPKELGELLGEINGFSVILEGVEENEGLSLAFFVVGRGAGNRNTIFVLCPVCGCFGKLVVREKKPYGRKYRVVHENGRNRGCNVSFVTRGYSAVNRIYLHVHEELEHEDLFEREVRRRERLRTAKR